MLNFPSLLPTKIAMDKLKPRLRITPLGDGYVQREADGLNTLRHYFTVSFIGLVK
ncbi:phage tail protein [Piscirickettsia salmonis]|uniref:phage tail protein n=1 Tax=Piscirickettsia salmonis TaxID=1238 RepID=UPI001EE311F7|nr:phage tail protein [Piscirickettsia salmonis]